MADYLCSRPKPLNFHYVIGLLFVENLQIGEMRNLPVFLLALNNGSNRIKSVNNGCRVAVHLIEFKRNKATSLWCRRHGVRLGVGVNKEMGNSLGELLWFSRNCIEGGNGFANIECMKEYRFVPLQCDGMNRIYRAQWKWVYRRYNELKAKKRFSFLRKSITEPFSVSQ